MEAEMKKIVLIACGALAASCAPTEPMEVSDRAQMELADAMRGRIAGEPVSCVNQRDLRGNRSAGEAAIIFDGPGDLIYVNRPPAGCPRLDSGRALQTVTPSTRLCRGDIVTVFDPVSGGTYGSCGLGDFVPYRRAG
jgi:hypothetical protein